MGNINDTIETGAIPDAEIINRVLLGEKELYALIVRRYNQRLFRIAISIMGDETETEDIMQVAYINAYENLGKFVSRSSFSTWVTRILINECLLRLKKRRRIQTMNDEAIDRESDRQYGPAVQTPVGTMMNQELKVILEKAIQNLPEKYRLVFVMREIEGLNIAETKECLDISAVNVKVRLNRAKALLKNSLAGYYSKEDLFHFQLTRCERMVNNVLQQLATSPIDPR